LSTYGVLPIEFAKVTKVYVLVQDLLKKCKTRIAVQEGKKSKFFEKFVGMEFNVEDRKLH
jgi:hypothetical protein